MKCDDLAPPVTPPRPVSHLPGLALQAAGTLLLMPHKLDASNPHAVQAAIYAHFKCAHLRIPDPTARDEGVTGGIWQQ
jgi:hypothetical protein